MKRSVFFVAAALATACGSSNALVGGDCMDGYVIEGGRCVRTEAPAAPGRSPSSSSDGPSSSTPPSPDAPTISADADAGSTTGSSPVVTCTPSDTDPNNCGACGKRCPSNICVGGECQGAITGDVIMIGHEYASSWSLASQTKLLVNAVSIPTTYPIRVADFTGGAWAAADERALLDGGVVGRSIAWSDASDPSFLEASDLARRFDVVLLHAAGDDGAALGARWATSLSTFAKKGGVVVALDDGSTDMPALVRNAGLLGVQGHTFLGAGAHVVVTAPGNVLGVQVISPYAPIGASFGFFGVSEDDDISFVARASTNGGVGLPVAIHRVVR